MKKSAFYCPIHYVKGFAYTWTKTYIGNNFSWKLVQEVRVLQFYENVILPSNCAPLNAKGLPL